MYPEDSVTINEKQFVQARGELKNYPGADFFLTLKKVNLPGLTSEGEYKVLGANSTGFIINDDNGKRREISYNFLKPYPPWKATS